jgi:hypothetical protein
MPDADSAQDVSWFTAPAGWTAEQPNPFSADGSYGPDWSGFVLRDADDDRGLYGRTKAGLFCQRVGRQSGNLEACVADFLRYECTHGRKVILAAPANVNLPLFAAAALAATPAGTVIRATDAQYVVHSTSPAAWGQICRCGCLKSLARLRREGVDVPGMGFAEFGEPADYAEHVMFAPLDGISPEIVVNCLLQGKFVYDENVPYTPGVRLYFDGHAIIRDGLAVRDGIHFLKVHDHLPLGPYLLAAVTAETVATPGQVDSWTPRTFLHAANAWFEAQRPS